MPKISIVYHKDLDGYASGAIAWRFHSDAVMIPMQHGEPFPWDKVSGSEIIYVLDFVLHHDGEKTRFEDMERLADSCHILYWIDHHVSANREYEEYRKDVMSRLTVYTTYVYDVTKAACELTWEFLHQNRNEPIPEVIKLIGSADIWRDHDTRKWNDTIEPVVLALQSFETDPKENMDIWNDILSYEWDTSIESLACSGVYIQDYMERKSARSAAQNAHEVVFEGHNCIAINSDNHSSSVLDSVFDESKHKIRLVYSLTKDQKWCVSVYSEDPEIDCAVICKKYKGGGHSGAGGFVSENLPWKSSVPNDVNEIEYYICTNCGSLVTNKELEEECSNGGQPYCYCTYMTYDWDSKTKIFQPCYDRMYQEYTKISKEVYDGLMTINNNCIRLQMFRTVHLK